MSSNNIYDQNHDSSKKYVVYITHYDGDKMPQNYIGSTNIQRINSGYKGSIRSKKYRQIWNEEFEQNPHLFSIEIISYHDTRPEAFYKELSLQQMFNVVNNPIFVNQSYASVNGYFGLLVTGKDHPSYGKHPTEETRKKMSENHCDVSGENNFFYGKTGEKNPSFNHSIYRFFNTETKETFEGYRFYFIKTYNLNNSCVSRLIHQDRKTHHNWILLENLS